MRADAGADVGAAAELARGDCPLCQSAGGATVWADARLRIIRVDDPDHPGFLRVVWNAHVREMGDLPVADRMHLMAAVQAAEDALRSLLSPDKINLASLGNQVPHLHWHVIARFAGDAHFPQPVWATRLREADPSALAWRRQRMQELPGALAGALRHQGLLAS
jgi:diadenosine tetraphosphate (Ap4A) HIT family hydrolase